MAKVIAVTPQQFGSLGGSARRRFAEDVRQLLVDHPVVGGAAAQRPIDWFDRAVARGQHHRLSEQLDLAEFTAQLLLRGDAAADAADARAALDHPTNPGWLRVRQFAEGDVLVDFGDA